MIPYQMLIDGEWVDSSITREVRNPATDEVVGQYSVASPAHIRAAIDSARRALPAWASLPVEQRSDIVRRAADAIRAKYGEAGEETALKRLIASEMGKLLPEADIEVAETSDMLDFFAEEACRVLADETMELNSELWPTKRSYIRYEPVGVVGVIKPWNYPLELPIWSIGPALVAGNTVVFKPSELASLVGLEIGRIFREAGLPAGVLNVITGGGDVGANLASSPGVDMITFTGSVATGKAVAGQCAQTMRRVVLELGGKDPAIVCEDADLDLAAAGVTWGAFTNAGQVCVGIERCYVHESIAPRFLAMLLSKVRALRLGVDVGPLVSKRQLDKVEQHVAEARSEGARVLAGGKRPLDAHLRKGYYYEPTVIVDVLPTMAIMRDETFGPILPIMVVSSDDEAVVLANECDYGLGASVWTGDLERGRRLASSLQAGMVWVNDVNVAFPQCPWGGIKLSGIGAELSRFGILEYVNKKHVSLELGPDQTRPWWYPYR